ncbi:MAG: hypothetical protein DMF84_15490 [Acidobacteria bacterium]|nr:MAG: hypothetical protein DMF84_15490 [Acidobacteriota bacterium]
MQAREGALNLQLATVTEAVTVTAESPLVDVKTSAKSTNIRAEQVELLPHGRDYTSLLTQAPGVNNEFKSAPAGQAGIMIDGAAAAENRYVVDGIETTNIIGGLSGKNVLTDYVEEVQVKSTGYPAEYGGSTGGVINVLTKSGTNAFHGSALTFYQGSRVTGENNQTLRAVFGVPTQAEYHTYPKDKNDRFEPGFSVGGPVFRDKMWFFGHRLRDSFRHDAEAGSSIRHRERDEPVRQQAPHTRGVQQQLVEDRRSARVGDGQRPSVHCLHQRDQVPELDRLGDGRLHIDVESRDRRARRTLPPGHP